MGTDTSGFSDIQSKNALTLTDIQDLQHIETELFATLTAGISNNSLTSTQKTDIIKKIQQISTMRTQLYANISGLQTFFQKNATFASTTLVEQINAIGIVENELNESKKRYKLIQEDKYNKLKLVEINTYYGDKYNNHTDIMKTVIFICIPIIFASILANYGLISQNIYSLLFIIITVIGVIYLAYQIYDSISRDNMSYQEYNWSNNTPINPPAVNINDLNAKVDPWAAVGLTCIGQNCCDTDFTYVPTPSNKCISNANLPAGVHPYVSPVSSSDISSVLT